MIEMSRFHRHMEYDRNTMIWAPRQSGKSYAIARKFVETPNAMMFVSHSSIRGHIDDILVDLGCPDRRRDVNLMTNADVVRGRQIDAVFVDEIDHYRGDLEEFLSNVRINTLNSARIIAVSTPNRVQEAGLYDRFFPNNINVEDRVVFTVPKEHFEEELFTV
jgi:hypothetical protein